MAGMDNNQNKEKYKNDGIDLLDVITKIWDNRRTIIIYMSIFLVLGMVILLFSPKKYRSEITLVVETSSSSTGLSSLIQQFGLSGLNVDKKGKDALSPELYTDVIQSIPFLLDVMKQKVTVSKCDTMMTVAEYLENRTRPSPLAVIYSYTVGLPSRIFSSSKNEPLIIKSRSDTAVSDTDTALTSDSTFDPIILSERDANIADALSSCIKTDDDFKKTNKFIITVEMQDPLVVAQVTSYVVKSLTKHIINYRTKKAKTDLEFVAARTKEAEENYIKTQQALASFKDRNKNVVLTTVQSQQDKLEAEYDLAYTMYNTLSTQLEQAKIKVQDETPVFNVVNPAQIPLTKSKPNPLFIIIVSILIGAWLGIVVVYAKSFLKRIRIKKNESGSDKNN